MRPRWGWVFFLLLASGCTDVSKLTPEVRGKGVFAAYNCQRCHRIGSVGGDSGPDLTFVGFRKTAAALDVWLKDPSAWQPDTLMPDFRLNDMARSDLAAYLATLKGEAFRQGTPPWDVTHIRRDPLSRGKALFQRAGCSSCHGAEGKGGYRNNNVIGGKIPDLTNVGEGFSREELIKKISRGVPQSVKNDPSGPEPLLYMPSWKEVLKEDEIAALADYLLALYPAPASGADGW